MKLNRAQSCCTAFYSPERSHLFHRLTSVSLAWISCAWRLTNLLSVSYLIVVVSPFKGGLEYLVNTRQCERLFEGCCSGAVVPLPQGSRVYMFNATPWLVSLALNASKAIDFGARCVQAGSAASSSLSSAATKLRKGLELA